MTRTSKHGHFIGTIRLTKQASLALAEGAETIAETGGPESSLAEDAAIAIAAEISDLLDPLANRVVSDYQKGILAAVVFEGLRGEDDPVPLQLPDLSCLERDRRSLVLASRSQILLALLGEGAFAYDIDNAGKLVRFVANFKGGGAQKVSGEADAPPVLSSHHGVALGWHTEAPYWATCSPRHGHSPAPSSLVLAARWNPLGEPTSIVPAAAVLSQLSQLDIGMLAAPHFGFSKSDSFTGTCEEPRDVSIIDHFSPQSVVVKFNIYRCFVLPSAPREAWDAFERLKAVVEAAKPEQVVLTPENAVVINNYAALHGRDVVRDNRRLLLRIFGYAKYVKAVEISKNPRIVRG